MSHILMSHIAHMDESCHTCKRVTSHIWMSHVTFRILRGLLGSFFHIWMRHVTRMDESCHTCGWIMSHIWKSHVTHMNESRVTNICVIRLIHMSHIWMSHVTNMNESCHTYERVMSPIWMSHESHIWMSRITHIWFQGACLALPHINESRHICEWVMSRINESWHTYEWVMCHTHRISRGLPGSFWASLIAIHSCTTKNFRFTSPWCIYIYMYIYLYVCMIYTYGAYVYSI